MMITEETTSRRVRSYFSVQHLISAELLAQHAQEIEDSIKRGESVPELPVRHRAYVVGSIISATAFLEATINELFSDTADMPFTLPENQNRSNPRVNELDNNTRTKMGLLWKFGVPRTASYKITEKYDIALKVAGKPPIKKEGSMGGIEVLVRLRNALIHYEPEWIEAINSDGKATEHKLGNQLKSQGFTLNPIAPQDAALYPHKILSFGCANWAIHCSVEYTDAFFSILDMTPTYDEYRSMLTPRANKSGKKK